LDNGDVPSWSCLNYQRICMVCPSWWLWRMWNMIDMIDMMLLVSLSPSDR
jgi:lipid A disaccharide synthetase